MAILHGYVLPEEFRKALHEKLGRDLAAEVYETYAVGHQMFVAPAPVSEKTGTGLLWKPRGVVDRQKLEIGAGWVIAVGPQCGTTGDLGPNAPHPVGIQAKHPSDILGAYVLFESYRGKTIRTSEEDPEDEWKGTLLAMTDRDILAFSPSDGV